MSQIDTLNRQLLIALGVKPETTDAIMEYIGALKQERDHLAEWRRQQLAVDASWKRIDEYVRATAHENGMTLGSKVSDHALKMIKEGHELKEEIRKIASTL